MLGIVMHASPHMAGALLPTPCACDAAAMPATRATRRASPAQQSTARRIIRPVATLARCALMHETDPS